MCSDLCVGFIDNVLRVARFSFKIVIMISIFYLERLLSYTFNRNGILLKDRDESINSLV